MSDIDQIPVRLVPTREELVFRIIQMIVNKMTLNNSNLPINIKFNKIGVPVTIRLYESHGAIYVSDPTDGNISGVIVPSLVLQQISTDVGHERKGYCSMVVEALETIVRDKIPLVNVARSPLVTLLAQTCKVDRSEFCKKGGYCRALHIQSILQDCVGDIFRRRGFAHFKKYGHKDQLFKVYPDNSYLGQIMARAAFEV